jgi:hypothetical protein
VRVENSLFTNQLNNGGSIFNGVGLSIERGFNTTAQITAEVVNNTAVGNQYGFLFAVPLGGTAFVPRFENNISYDNRVTDLVLRRPVLVAYSIWGTQDLSDGGALASGSGSNLNVDPLLDATYQPIEPASPAINSGRNTPSGGLPSSDYDGGKRLIGTRVDRGAYESAVNDSTVLTVTSTANSGAGTLRQAILDANSSPGTKTIEFNIFGFCPRVIALSSALPALTESTTIAGYTQPGSAQNESARAFDGTLCIALTGGGTIATGLSFDTGAGEAMAVEGIAFYGFTSEGLKITGTGSGFARGNGFGTGANAPIAVPEFADAAIRVNGAPGSEIGGSDIAQRNVIARGTQAGIRLEASSGGRLVKNNLIGYTTSGTAALANGIGITVDGSFRDVITSNLIGFNTTQGIRILNTGTPAQETSITKNDVGVSATFGDAGNGTNGIRIESGEGHFVEFNSIPPQWHRRPGRAQHLAPGEDRQQLDLGQRAAGDRPLARRRQPDRPRRRPDRRQRPAELPRADQGRGHGGRRRGHRHAAERERHLHHPVLPQFRVRRGRLRRGPDLHRAGHGPDHQRRRFEQRQRLLHRRPRRPRWHPFQPSGHRDRDGRARQQQRGVGVRRLPERPARVRGRLRGRMIRLSGPRLDRTLLARFRAAEALLPVAYSISWSALADCTSRLADWRISPLR